MLTQDNIRQQRAIDLGLKPTASWAEIHFAQQAKDSPGLFSRWLMFFGF